MREHLSMLGCRIRELRKKRSMTLQKLASETQLSAGLLSQIENFRTVPSLPALLEIARALESDLSALFDGIGLPEKREYILIRPEDQKPVERNAGHGLSYRLLLETPLDAVNMQVMIVTPGNSKERELVRTDGWQQIYMLSGEVRYRLGTESLRLAEGDLLFFNGALPHCVEYETGDHFSMLVFYFLHPRDSACRNPANIASDSASCASSDCC